MDNEVKYDSGESATDSDAYTVHLLLSSHITRKQVSR